MEYFVIDILPGVIFAKAGIHNAFSQLFAFLCVSANILILSKIPLAFQTSIKMSNKSNYFGL